MKRLEIKNTTLVQKQFDAYCGIAWQEVKVEHHAHYDELPVFILLYKDYDLKKTGMVAAGIVDWYYKNYDWPRMTIGFQLLDAERKYIVAYEEGANIVARLRNLQPFDDIEAEPRSSGTVFQSSMSLPTPK